MKDLKAKRSIRKQPRVTYKMQKHQLERGKYLQERLLPSTGSFLPTARVSQSSHVLACTAAVTPCAQLSIKPAQSWFLGAFSFQRSMEKLEEELSLDPPCPQTPAHTHTHVCTVVCRFCGCGNLLGTSVVWGLLWWKWRQLLSVSWSKRERQKRKKRRQTQVFNKTFINDFPGRMLALAQRAIVLGLNYEKFILSTKHCKKQPSKAQCFPPTRRSNWAAGFWNFTAFLHTGILLRHHSHTKPTWMGSGIIPTVPAEMSSQAVHCSSRCTQKGHWLIHSEMIALAQSKSNVE